MSDLNLKIWRLHPSGCPVVPAERTLQGTANRGAVRWCGPFTNANKSGWWLYSPVDIDIVWNGGKDFDYTLHTPYDDTDRHLVEFLADEEDREHMFRWLGPAGRTKFTWGLLEDGVVQIWTGCIFSLPSEWGLHLRSPVNLPRQPYYVMEAVIEADWLQYDIWLNLAFDRPGETARLRREGWPPIAQIVPVRRESYDARWSLDEETINRNSDEAERAFRFFVEYNRKKFAGEGTEPIAFSDPPATKDPATYFKERKRIFGERKK